MVAVNVAQLLKAPTGETRSFAFEEPAATFAPDLDLVGPVRGRVRLLRTARGILVACDYTTQVHVDCSRCLVALDVEVQSRFEEEALPSINIRTGEWIPEQPGEDNVRIDERNVLELDDLIRQDVLVNVPLRPLCDLGCKGLCERCGQSLNTGACQCEPAASASEPALGRLGEALQREMRRKHKGA